jgi:hypothetical protein
MQARPERPRRSASEPEPEESVRHDESDGGQRRTEFHELKEADSSTGPLRRADDEEVQCLRQEQVSEEGQDGCGKSAPERDQQVLRIPEGSQDALGLDRGPGGAGEAHRAFRTFFTLGCSFVKILPPQLSQRTPNRFASLGNASPQRMHRNMIP